MLYQAVTEAKVGLQVKASVSLFATVKICLLDRDVISTTPTGEQSRVFTFNSQDGCYHWNHSTPGFVFVMSDWLKMMVPLRQTLKWTRLWGLLNKIRCLLSYRLFLLLTSSGLCRWVISSNDISAVSSCSCFWDICWEAQLTSMTGHLLYRW